VWNFDECAAHVNGVFGWGWVVLDDNNSDRKDFIKKGAKGKRLNLSGFISAEYGVLRDDDDLLVGAFSFGTTNTAKSTTELFEWAAEIVTRRWPHQLHVFFTDGPRIHTRLVDGACNPNYINMADGGANRMFDNLFGEAGFRSIYENWFEGDGG
jgi:hypothetical protein